jgi:hypothetical protein
MIPGINDEMSYAIRVVMNERTLHYNFLWRDEPREDIDHHVRAIAFLALSSNPRDKRELNRAVQRELYREARSWGWRRPTASARFEREPLIDDLTDTRQA